MVGVADTRPLVLLACAADDYVHVGTYVNGLTLLWFHNRRCSRARAGKRSGGEVLVPSAQGGFFHVINGSVHGQGEQAFAHKLRTGP